MAISDSVKTDLLFKKVAFGVTETNTGKSPSEESIASPATILSTQVWQQADKIPTGAIAVPDIVEAHDTGVFLVRDPTVTSGKTWLAIRDPEFGLEDNNRLHDFIPFTVGPSYEVKIFTKDDLSGRLLPNTANEEWIFDYSAGVLFFPNNLPTSVTTDTLYITGYRYIGKKGVGSDESTTPQKQSVTLTYRTQTLALNQVEQFILPTGGMFVVQNLEVDVACKVECHTTSAYADKNPYVFLATDTHKSDDGSYVSNGNVYYGPRFITLMNLENPSSGASYWRITQLKGTGSINLTITVVAL